MLAMPMSSGKTRVAIDYIQTEDIRTVLVLCPHHVLDVWPGQFAKHLEYPEDYVITVLDKGTVKKRTQIAQKAAEQADHRTQIFVINYQAAFRKPFRDWSLNQQWDLVILDESHRIKKAGGKQSFYVKALRDRAERRLALTGTPMPHSPLDLYGQFRFLAPSVFGTRVDAFKLAYCHLGGFSGQQIIGWHNLDDLQRRYHSLAFESSEAELGLPPEQDITRHCILDPKARKHYDELKKDYITQTKKGVITASNAAVKLLRFQQLTGGFLQHREHPKAPLVTEIVGRAKADLLLDVLADLPPREPLVIFCRFTPDLKRVHALCHKSGRTSSELSGHRKELREWQAGKTDVLVAQVQSGNEGIDLTRARYAVCWSLGFSSGDYRQIRRRLCRTTQSHPVTYIHLICRDTVDQQVYRGFTNQLDVIQMIQTEGLQ